MISRDHSFSYFATKFYIFSGIYLISLFSFNKKNPWIIFSIYMMLKTWLFGNFKFIWCFLFFLFPFVPKESHACARWKQSSVFAMVPHWEWSAVRSFFPCLWHKDTAYIEEIASSRDCHIQCLPLTFTIVSWYRKCYIPFKHQNVSYRIGIWTTFLNHKVPQILSPTFVYVSQNQPSLYKK